MTEITDTAIARVAEFLKLRDESVEPHEATDAERLESAKAILETISFKVPTEQALAREIARRRGHTDLDHEGWINDPGFGQPIWKFYLDDARAVLKMFSAPSEQPEPVADLWQELCERDDRTSPEEYPEMCLITFEEFSDFIRRASGGRAEIQNIVRGVLPLPPQGDRP